ncbi:STAS/SEC14 domain-containing protein [Pseudonocardia spirodelae]|uniref:STAS/SEC14 domain-containing protein n=1 Tax=Pseudonocardia spirodelae TaxID=3133431 RepID=A0ABU8T2L7_9PSEU
MLRLVDGLPDGVVGVAASGVLTGADLVDVLVPALRSADGGALLLEVDDTTDTAVPGACGPLPDPDVPPVRACAITAAPGTVAAARRIAAALRPRRTRVFGPAERDAAVAWLAAGPPARRRAAATDLLPA